MMEKFRFLILILIQGNLLCAYSYAAMAQPGNINYNHLIEANSLFYNGEYEKALINYRVVIEQQPSNNYVLEQIRKAEEELLYAEIMAGNNAEQNSLDYISEYGDEGKYIVNVKNVLSQKLLSQAYRYYQAKDIELLESTYIEYLTLLGSVKSNEMKQWLYSLCNEEAVKSLKGKKWTEAKTFFERSLKFASTNAEFSDAQKGIARASKKIR